MTKCQSRLTKWQNQPKIYLMLKKRLTSISKKVSGYNIPPPILIWKVVLKIKNFVCVERGSTPPPSAPGRRRRKTEKISGDSLRNFHVLNIEPLNEI